MAASIVDLRSDLVSPPTPAMVKAMAAALASPQAFDFREDKTQRRLEERVADLTGQEDALLFPTCTMANQTAVELLCPRGAAVLLDAESHIATSESGAPAAQAGVMPFTVPAKDGCLDLKLLASVLSRPTDAQRSKPGLIVLENTHNRSGGRVVPVEHHLAVVGLAKRHRVPVHLDGARLFNAAVAHGKPLRAFTAGLASVSLSLNKGLCAPLGAMLAGSRDFIADALVLRQRLGGGIRPTGALAAAGLIAVERMIDRLADDHAQAKRLSECLAEFPGIEVLPVETNLVVIGFGDAAALVRDLAERGVLVLPFGPGRIRLAVHRGIGKTELARTLAAFHRALARPARGRGAGR